MIIWLISRSRHLSSLVFPLAQALVLLHFLLNL